MKLGSTLSGVALFCSFAYFLRASIAIFEHWVDSIKIGLILEVLRLHKSWHDRVKEYFGPAVALTSSPDTGPVR